MLGPHIGSWGYWLTLLLCIRLRTNIPFEKSQLLENSRDRLQHGRVNVCYASLKYDFLLLMLTILYSFRVFGWQYLQKDCTPKHICLWSWGPKSWSWNECKTSSDSAALTSDHCLNQWLLGAVLSQSLDYSDYSGVVSCHLPCFLASYINAFGNSVLAGYPVDWFSKWTASSLAHCRSG